MSEGPPQIELTRLRLGGLTPNLLRPNPPRGLLARLFSNEAVDICIVFLGRLSISKAFT
jgi:hypothetical protein